MRQRLHPPTIAASHWPDLMERRARSNARRLEEQAVSMAKLGPDEQSTYQAAISRYLQLICNSPLKSKKYEILLANMDRVQPVIS